MKDTVTIVQDLVCQDSICLTIECIAVCADVLPVLTSFVPGSHVTSVITIPTLT